MGLLLPAFHGTVVAGSSSLHNGVVLEEHLEAVLQAALGGPQVSEALKKAHLAGAVANCVAANLKT